MKHNWKDGSVNIANGEKDLKEPFFRILKRTFYGLSLTNKFMNYNFVWKKKKKNILTIIISYKQVLIIIKVSSFVMDQ